MRAGSDRVFRLLQFDPPDDLSADEVEFRHLRSVPQAAPGAFAIAGGDHRVRERRRYQIAGAQVEALQHFAICRIKQHNIVGKIVGHQKFVGCAGCSNQGQSSRIRNSSAWRRLQQTDGNSLPGRQLLRRNRNKSFGRHFTVRECVESNPVSGVAGLFAGGISQGADGSIEVLAVRTERQSQKIALVSFLAQPGFGEIRDAVRLQVKDGNRLVRQRLLGSVAAIQ